jgi:protein MpaA
MAKTDMAIRTGFQNMLFLGSFFIGMVLLTGCAQPRLGARTAIKNDIATTHIETEFEIGKSVEGRPIKLYVFGDRKGFDKDFNLKINVQPLLIIGGTHGNEPTSSALACNLIDYLKRHPEIYHQRYIAILPELNPDGLAAGKRQNAHDVDLNRNLPSANWKKTPKNGYYGGEIPSSEPENQALIAVVEGLRPVRILTLHSIRKGRHGNNYDGPALYLAKLMSAKNGYPILKTMGYPTPGSLGSWAGVDQHIPTVTLELPREDTAEICWQENADAIFAFIRGGGD